MTRGLKAAAFDPWQGLGLRPADILLPRAPYLNQHWPVVALDQYTSQPGVWRQVERVIGDQPSTLRLIVPEAFLAEAETRGPQVLREMQAYLDRGLFETRMGSLMLVERETQSGKRIGLVAMIDLEEYAYAPGNRALIRATEETVLDRIPPRQKVREQSPIELPHVMLLVDDPNDSLLGPLYGKRAQLAPAYDLNLLMGGGRLRGWQVEQEADLGAVAAALRALKAGLRPDGMLFAVGDGNHSLAAAKASWDKQKAGLDAAEAANHPARFALVELVNLHSPALLFEPIHRLAFGTGTEQLLSILSPLRPEQKDAQPDITLLTREGTMPLTLRGKGEGLVLGAVQALLDEARLELDYVHGADALRDILNEHEGTGILMPEFEKSQLFPSVERDGRLPRKTFSMGEANEKRFYLEARRIR